MYNNYLPNNAGQRDRMYDQNHHVRSGGTQAPAIQSSFQQGKYVNRATEYPGYGYMPKLPLAQDEYPPKSYQKRWDLNKHLRQQRQPEPYDDLLQDTWRQKQNPSPQPSSDSSDQTGRTFRSQLSFVAGSQGPYQPMMSSKPAGNGHSASHRDEGSDEDPQLGNYNGRSARSVDKIVPLVLATDLSDSSSSSSQTLTRVSSATAIGAIRPTPTPYTLAQAIMRGETEDPAEEVKLHRKYTTPSKLQQPGTGPTRFQNSRMFNTVNSNEPPAIDREPTQETSQSARTGLGPVEDIPNPLWHSTVQQGLCLPTVEELLDDLPIAPLCNMVSPSTAGVVKIRDIPYCTPRSEMLAFLGRNCQVVRQPEASPYYAVHILMERESGKTLDCYVEVSSDSEAAFVARAFKKRSESGRPPKVGERTVEVVYSSQDELLSELFPRAKHTHWKNGQPIVDLSPRTYYEGEKAVGFQGFIHPEELIMLRKHVTLKERSPFASRSPTRTYEALISIMNKYPWYAPKYCPIHERDRIYKCVLNLMGCLVQELRELGGRPRLYDPTPALLQEMATAALVCPGFSEVQKAKIAAYLQKDGFGYMAAGIGANLRLGGSHALAAHWPFVALSVKPGSDIDFVKYYGYLFHQATHPNGLAYPILPMGDVKIKYQGEDDASNISLAAAAKIEVAKIEELINKVIGPPPSRRDSPYPDDRVATSPSESAYDGHGSSNHPAEANYHGYGTTQTRFIQPAQSAYNGYGTPQTRPTYPAQSAYNGYSTPQTRPTYPAQSAYNGYGTPQTRPSYPAQSVHHGNAITQTRYGPQNGQHYTLAQAIVGAEDRNGYKMTEPYGRPQSSASTSADNGSQSSDRYSARQKPPGKTSSDPTATENRDTVGKVMRSAFTW